MRVLKPTGSMWVNLGDKYNSAASGQNGTGKTGLYDGKAIPGTRPAGRHDRMGSRGESTATVPQKSLIGLPWRYAIRCIDDLGLILRAEVIWSKPNGLPESVTDRVRRSHETWFHFTRSPRYFAAVDTIREPASGYTRPNGAARATPSGQRPRAMSDSVNPLGSLPGSVWTVATQPLKVPAELGIDHFAAFPMEWPRRIIQGWSPSGICTACGEGRRPTSQTERVATCPEGLDRIGRPMDNRSGVVRVRSGIGNVRTDRAITGEACACPDTSAPTRPAVVLDPFGGTGTTALVASVLGRHGISVDMSADYCRLAEWRVNDPGQRAAALEVEKPAVQHVGQLDLFAGEGAA
jgi:DNA modification methylase